ncbi:MAG: translesion DNA synthesis-associated protein ImuA [Kangiellaceae bacterium]
MPSIAINQLLKNTGIWQVSTNDASSRRAISTGYAPLDKQLHYGGWPQGAVSELLLSQNGIGEIRLISPLLAKLNQKPGYVVWVNPPYQPYAPALLKQQIKLDKMLIIKAKSTQESIWAAEQALTSQSCSAVLVWLPTKNLSKEIRKLNLAAKTGHCWGFVLRSSQLQEQASAASLRIVMRVQQKRQYLHIIKQPGGWNGQKIDLDLFPERENWNSSPVNQWPVFSPEKDSKNNFAKNSFSKASQSYPTKIIAPKQLLANHY